jgi:hypothetical protein
MLLFYADATQGSNEEFFMSQVGNNEDRFGGEFMIQDHDHMADIGQGSGNAKRGRQAEQGQSEGRQQGGDHSSASQQGGGRKRQGRVE